MNLTKTFLAAGAFAIFGGAGFAATVGPYNVDTLLTTARQCNEAVCDFTSSDPGTEIGFLEDFLGVAPGTLELDDKFEDATLEYSQDDAGNWFADVGEDTPGWFILKFGVAKPDIVAGQATHFFFENLDDLRKLVWTSAQVAPLMDNCSVSEPGEILGEGDCRLSHITTVVPLPAAGWLLIGGLGGLMAMRRRKS